MSAEKTEIEKRLEEIEQQIPELRKLLEAGDPWQARDHAKELAHGLRTLAHVIDIDAKHKAYASRRAKRASKA